MLLEVSHFGFYLSRKPSHPQLEAFIKHMSKGSAAQMDGSLSSLPHFPSHSLCEMGELTQTGEFPSSSVSSSALVNTVCLRRDLLILFILT